MGAWSAHMIRTPICAYICHTPCFVSGTLLTMFPLNFKHQIIHIPSLAAALIKLNINISVEDLMKAVYEEDEARRARAKLNEEAEHALLSRRKSTVIFSPASVTLMNTLSHSPARRGGRQCFWPHPCRFIGEGTSSSLSSSYGAHQGGIPQRQSFKDFLRIITEACLTSRLVTVNHVL